MASTDDTVAKPAAPAGVRPARRRRLAVRPSILAGRVGGALLLFGLWEIGSGRLFDSFYFSRPSLIFAKIATELVSDGFYNDLWVTAQELAAGYTLGALAGVTLGVLLARWEWLAEVLSPFLLALNSIPRIALAPMLIVWFGIGMASKIFLGATLVFFITFFNTLSGVRGVDPAYCDVARVQGATSWQIFTKVMLPSASAWILTGLKMSLPFALVGVILGEFLVSSQGLGYRLNAYSTGYDTTGALAMVFLMMLIMMLLSAAMDVIEGRVLRWRPKSEAGALAPRA